jgi:hypothetical protein
MPENGKQPETKSTAEKQPSKEKSREDQLALWVRSQVFGEGYDEAKFWLQKGPPFKGISLFESKERVKDLGCKWIPNPQKQKGVPFRDDGLVAGWWSTDSLTTIERLIGLGLSDVPKYKESKHGKQRLPDQWHWRPDSVSGDPRTVVRIIQDFERYMEAERDSQIAATRKKPVSRDEAGTRHDLGVREDSTEEIQLLLKYGITWTPVLAQKSLSGVSGPRSGASDAMRVIRALKFGVISTSDVMSPDFGDRPSAKRNRVVSVATERPSNAVCLHFARGEAPNEGEAARRQEAAENADRMRVSDLHTPIPAMRTTICTTCATEVVEQFSDCACGCEWKWCERCCYAVSFRQACACTNTRWVTEQNDARRVIKKRELEAYFALQAMASQPDVPVAKSDDDDDESESEGPSALECILHE